MKYINADKLIAKIEKRKSILDVESPFGVGGIIELELVLDTITYLQQEQPSEDLEKAAVKYTYNPTTKTIGKAWLTRDVRLAFIAGAKWQKEQMMKDAISCEWKGGTCRVNGEEQPFEGGHAKIIILKDD